MSVLTLPESVLRVRYPVPQRVIVKWSQWVAWRDDMTGDAWVRYSIRHTAEPVPERFGDVKGYDPNRSFLTRESADGEVWMTSFVSRYATAHIEDVDALVEMVREGRVPVTDPADRTRIWSPDDAS